MNGRHLFIADGEDVKSALNRDAKSIANHNEDVKERQIAQNQKQASALNEKEENPSFVNKNLQKMVDDIAKAREDKSLDSASKKQILDNFKQYLNKNTQISEKSAPNGSHILNVTGNRAWYVNKSGTLFILSPKGQWIKFGNDLSMTNDGKISSEGKERVRALADELHKQKGWS